MNTPEDNAWEARLDRALQALPELPAPSGLVERTMARLERRPKPAWHQRPWISWPLWLRVASFSAMLALVGGSCFIKWEFARTSLGSALGQEVSAQCSNWTLAVTVADTLGRAAVAFARHLNSWVVLLCVIAATAAYLACIGLGSAARLAFSRR